MKKTDFKPLELSDRDSIVEIFSKYPPVISEYTFSNLFIWRKKNNTRTLILNDGAFFIMSFNSYDFLLPPAGFKDYHEAWMELIDLFLSDKSIKGIIKIPEKDIFLPCFKDFIVKEDRDHFDYVYKTEDFATLKGRRYDGKRWLIKKFIESVPHETMLYDPELHMEDSILLARKWETLKISQHPENLEGYKAETEALIEYLHNFASLHCCGMIIISSGKVIAFSFGEKLNPETFVIHFEKADPSYPGIYQAMSHLFVKNLVSGHFNFINREQDMGIEGLRNAKMSWHPYTFIKKFKILKDDFNP